MVPNGFVWLAKPIPDFWEGTPLAAFGWITAKPSRNAFALLYPAGKRTFGLPSTLVFPGDGEIADYEYPIARLLVSFWLLAKQRLAVSTVAVVSRAVRRRATVQEIKTVRVVGLRRKTYPETDGTRKVDWTHRWLVRGFWRNQWYPSEERHKPIWIADHVKGPAAKPFVAKHRSFEFTR